MDTFKETIFDKQSSKHFDCFGIRAVEANCIGCDKQCEECKKEQKLKFPTIQVDAKEYERLKELDKKQLIKEFEKRYSNNPYGIVYSTLEETKEDKDHSTFILFVSIIILLGYIIYKIETYFNS